ncbi:hypothetical protein FVB9288_02200 [Flavobacterium sp. CECT 9288]|nr:hypothetical protein FVB9288_02200 [Flavobacterium sp. CECT 9288]
MKLKEIKLVIKTTYNGTNPSPDSSGNPFSAAANKRL